MNLKSLTPMIRAALIALVVLAVGWTGLDIPRDAVEETVDASLDGWQAVNEAQDAEEVDVDRAFGALSTPAVVTSVIDGDTAVVVIDDQEATLRFIGIDTPETQYSPAGAECYGDKATARARELLDGQTVTLTTDPTQATRDVHGRLLVYAQLPDGRDFGEVLLGEGHAREYTYAADYANQARYQAAQAQAQAAAAGLHAACE